MNFIVSPRPVLFFCCAAILTSLSARLARGQPPATSDSQQRAATARALAESTWADVQSRPLPLHFDGPSTSLFDLFEYSGQQGPTHRMPGGTTLLVTLPPTAAHRNEENPASERLRLFAAGKKRPLATFECWFEGGKSDPCAVTACNLTSTTLIKYSRVGYERILELKESDGTVAVVNDWKKPADEDSPAPAWIPSEDWPAAPEEPTADRASSASPSTALGRAIDASSTARSTVPAHTPSEVTEARQPQRPAERTTLDRVKKILGDQPIFSSFNQWIVSNDFQAIDTARGATLTVNYAARSGDVKFIWLTTYGLDAQRTLQEKYHLGRFAQLMTELGYPRAQDETIKWIRECADAARKDIATAGNSGVRKRAGNFELACRWQNDARRERGLSFASLETVITFDHSGDNCALSLTEGQP